MLSRAGNQLVARLPLPDQLRLQALCEPVTLDLSAPMGEAGDPTVEVLFPAGGFVSLVTCVPGHEGLEVGMVGREGMLGVQLALGVAVTPMRVVVQGGGTAWRIGRAAFLQELDHSPALRQLLHRYVYVLLAQMATASACRRFHAIGPRLARWLLMSHDRAQTDHFHVTHEFLALMLGVRRVGVTVAAGLLQARGFIRYHRGELVVLDRPGLEHEACSCYEADNGVYEAHLGVLDTVVRRRTDSAGPLVQCGAA